MAAVTSDQRITIENGNTECLGYYPMIATTGVVYAGTFVMLDASGNATTLTDAANVVFGGVAKAGAVNTGVAGAVKAEVFTGGDFHFPIQGTTLDATDIGKTVYALDNYTITDKGTPTNDIAVGQLIRLESATVGVVRIFSQGSALS